MESYIEKLGRQAKEAAKKVLLLETEVKNNILREVAKELRLKKEEIKKENEIDLIKGKEAGLSNALLDRLRLNDDRIESMAASLEKMANLADPVGEILSGWKHKNGMLIEKKRVPLGVIGMIYESRPNVTVDSAGLALKAGNTIILRGSSNAIHSNKCLSKLFAEAGERVGLPQHAIQLVEELDRKMVLDMITTDEHIDVLIPRGGQNLKKFVIKNATIPVIETGAGVCHIFVDETANIENAINIIKNAKTQRPSTCNTVETVLIHKNIAGVILPKLTEELLEKGVELRYSQEAWNVLQDERIVLAKEEDFGFEYLDLVLALKMVDTVEEAICFINENGSHHSDAIITENIGNAEKFLNEVDSAAVYLNASTRFTDGDEYGFGGEIGISTQKLHARGPMGIKELTTTKYIIRGNGEIRK